jgi:pimeloyl-ACP methyl ester carboxylesterase
VSIATLAADAARVLDDRELDSAHVLGLSMGAGVALELALRMPHRVRSLILVGGGAGGPTTVRPPLREAAGAIRGVLSDSVRHRRAWPAAVLFSQRFRDEHPDRVASYMPSFARHRASPWTSGWQLLAVACFGRRGSLRRAIAPTLIVHGGLDVMAPVANARMLAEGIPNAELHAFPDAGHAVPLEYPQASARLLVDWVWRHAAVRPAAPSRLSVIGERVTRGVALPTGTLRNSREAAEMVRAALRAAVKSSKSRDDNLPADV